MGRINDSIDLKYYYEREEIAYSEEYTDYYDPDYNIYYSRSGNIFHPHDHYNHKWFEAVRFYFIHGPRCYLPEQDQRLQDKKPAQQPPQDPDNTSITNFIELGLMSTCTKTKFNSSGKAITNWRIQIFCSFSIMSVVGDRCMHWNSDLDGHCDCLLAYDHKKGKSVDLSSTERIKQKDKNNNLPSDHHFEDAREISMNSLSELFHKTKQLIKLRDTSDADASIYYYKDWDVFFDGYGKFLEHMTTKRRKDDCDPDDFVQSWTEPLSMKKDEDQWTKHVINQLFTDKPNAIDRIDSKVIPGDYSGSVDPLELHQMYHNLQKISKKTPRIWPLHCFVTDGRENESIDPRVPTIIKEIAKTDFSEVPKFCIKCPVTFELCHEVCPAKKKFDIEH